MDIKFLNKESFYRKVKKLEDGHWTRETINRRWDYHYRVIELLKSIPLERAENVLEMGTMGVTCVKGSDTIDYLESWDFEGKAPTFVHDARKTPWPLKDKSYEVFVALRVFQHLIPKQQESLKEAYRIAKKIIIVVPSTYNNKVIPDSKGINYAQTVSSLNGIHPNLYIPTSFGDLYYWDTEQPSKLNIEKTVEGIEGDSNNNEMLIKNTKTVDLGKLFTKRLINKLKVK